MIYKIIFIAVIALVFAILRRLVYEKTGKDFGFVDITARTALVSVVILTTYDMIKRFLYGERNNS